LHHAEHEDEPRDGETEADERGSTRRVTGSTDPRSDGCKDGDDGEQLFVYGFADFLDAATSAIEASGVDPDDAKVENFG
jgi:3-phenylpropionate/trans-cinnamate dioxygenase ferredoxin reductase subunit